MSETTTPAVPAGGPAGARSSARQEDNGWLPVIARQLLDHARLCGFTFQRTAPGADAALVGHRVSDDWVDLIRIEGFSRDCSAWREWTSSLIVSPDALGQCQHRVQGTAVDVLNEVLTWELSL